MASITIFHWRDYKHPDQGGSTMNIVHIAEHLARNGHNVIMLTEKYNKNLPTIEIHNGVEYHHIGNKISQFLLLPIYFLRNIKSKTDVVIEAYDAWPFLSPILHKNIIMLICHIQKEEWVMEFGAVFGNIFRHIASFLLKFGYKNSTIVSISRSTTESIYTENIKPKSVTEIPVGVEDLIFANSIPKKPTDRIVCCTPSRLKSHKRFDLAIELIAEYNQNQRPPNGKLVHFDIVGAGNHEEYLRSLVEKLKAQEYIHFHGRASDEIKRDLLSTAHLHLQFSKREGWGITVIEAACQGAPTLCFDIPGLRDSVTEETGYLVNSKKELYKRFPEIIASIESNDSEYESRVKKGFNYAQQFRWTEIYKTWDGFIERALERSTR